MRKRTILSLLILILLVTACVSAGGSREGGKNQAKDSGASAPVTVVSQPTVKITEEKPAVFPYAVISVEAYTSLSELSSDEPYGEIAVSAAL